MQVMQSLFQAPENSSLIYLFLVKIKTADFFLQSLKNLIFLTFLSRFYKNQLLFVKNCEII